MISSGSCYYNLPHGTYEVGVDSDQRARLLSQHDCGVDSLPLLERNIRPYSTIHLAGCRLSRQLITNHQFRYYLEELDARLLPPGFKRVAGFVELDGVKPEDPVLGLAREEAMGYCRHHGGRLATADEWEVAVRSDPSLRPGATSGFVFEWTGSDETDEDGRKKAVVVGGCEEYPLTRCPGYQGLRQADAGYTDVGFRWAGNAELLSPAITAGADE